MNWKLVEPGTVEFAPGESLGQLVPVPHSTFEQAHAAEGPVDADPATTAELLRWQEERRKRITEPVRTHHLYRKAEGIDDHLVKVGVPPFTSEWPKTSDGTQT